MGRLFKSGLDYFPLDTKMDDEIELIESEHGVVGFGVLIKLYQKIYASNYWIKWDKKAKIMFSNRINVGINTIDAIINSCIEWDVFNKKIFDKFEVLTSNGIQKRYFEIIKRRLSVNIIKEYTLINYGNYLDINKINVSINTINEDISTQSKVKEIESKVKENIKYIIDYLNKVLGTKYKHDSKKTIEFITVRIKEGFNGKDFKTVIDKKFKDWAGTDDAKYLRPETLFGNKFEGYLNQLANIKTPKDDGGETAQKEFEETKRIINGEL